MLTRGALFAITPEELVTEAHQLDCRFWESVRDDQQMVRDAFPTRASAIVGNDLFNSLYHFRPKVRQNPPEPQRASVLGKIMDSSDWMGLHDATMGDDMLAAAGATRLRVRMEEDHKSSDVAKKLEQLEELREIHEAIEALGEGGQLNKELQQQKDNTESQMVQLQADLEDALNNRHVVSALRRAMKKSTQDIQNAVNMAGGWGNEPGTLCDCLFNPELSLTFTEPKIRRILDMAGKMREAISAERAKRPRPGPQKVKLGMGTDLHRVVPAELAMIGDPDLEDIFLRKYTEQSLLLYERDEKPRMGKGAFIICIDESGSMSGAKEEWGKALAFALCQQAHREKRTFAAIAFSSTKDQRAIVRPEPSEFLEWMRMFYNGGTDFAPPLQKSFDIISKDLPEADILFVTDGEAMCDEPFIQHITELKTRLSVKIIGIQIGTASLNGLQPFSDATFRLNTKRGAGGLEAVIEEMK